jgi:hypothetical protein
MCIVSIYRLNDYSLIVYNIYIQNTKLLILIAFNNYYYYNNNINTSKERERRRKKKKGLEYKFIISSLNENK